MCRRDCKEKEEDAQAKAIIGVSTAVIGYEGVKVSLGTRVFINGAR